MADKTKANPKNNHPEPPQPEPEYVDEVFSFEEENPEDLWPEEDKRFAGPLSKSLAEEGTLQPAETASPISAPIPPAPLKYGINNPYKSLRVVDNGRNPAQRLTPPTQPPSLPEQKPPQRPSVPDEKGTTKRTTRETPSTKPPEGVKYRDQGNPKDGFPILSLPMPKPYRRSQERDRKPRRNAANFTAESKPGAAAQVEPAHPVENSSPPPSRTPKTTPPPPENFPVSSFLKPTQPASARFENPREKPGEPDRHEPGEGSRGSTLTMLRSLEAQPASHPSALSIHAPQAASPAVPNQEKPSGVPLPRPTEGKPLQPSHEPAKTLADVLDRHPELPASAALLGLCEDGLPLVLDLEDRSTGSLLLVSDDSFASRKHLGMILASVQSLNQPENVRIHLVTRRPDRFNGSPHLMDILSPDDDKTYHLLSELVGLVENRLTVAKFSVGRSFISSLSGLVGFSGFAPTPNQAEEQPVLHLLVIDQLELVLQQMEPGGYAFLRWLLRRGPQMGVWTIASYTTSGSNTLFSVEKPVPTGQDWKTLRAFNMVLFGKTRCAEIVQGLSNIPALRVANLVSGSEALVPAGGSSQALDEFSPAQPEPLLVYIPAFEKSLDPKELAE